MSINLCTYILPLYLPSLYHINHPFCRMNKKTELGQFFTVNPLWLKKHIRKFIYNSGCNVIYDPFAGSGE